MRWRSGRSSRTIYVHAPDRLARSHAHQVLLIELGFRRAAVEVVFLNRTIGDTAEDNLLLQVQGIIAEYERSNFLNVFGVVASPPRAPARSAR